METPRPGSAPFGPFLLGPAVRPAAAGGPAEFTAADGVTLEIRQGELFGFLGPNGAGKTTPHKILGTLLAPTGGRAWADGPDAATHTQAVRERINMAWGGETSGYGVLTVRENLGLFSQLYGVPRKAARPRGHPGRQARRP